MKYVKFDMHCHTAEGSVDAKVNIEDYIAVSYTHLFLRE